MRVGHGWRLDAGEDVYKRQVAEVPAEELELTYRHSALEGTDRLVTAATVRLTPAEPEAIRERMRELIEKRRASQPLDMPSAGSTFKRPTVGYAAALIDQSGDVYKRQVIRLAAPAAVSDVQEHGRIADGDDQRELPVEHKEHDERAGHLDEALYDHGEAVVERVGYGVHVVGEVAHDVAAVAAVEPDEGQVLSLIHI